MSVPILNKLTADGIVSNGSGGKISKSFAKVKLQVLDELNLKNWDSMSWAEKRAYMIKQLKEAPNSPLAQSVKNRWGREQAERERVILQKKRIRTAIIALIVIVIGYIIYKKYKK